MIVDDGLHIIDVVKMILEKSGYNVATANSAEEALKKLEKGKVDLILLDAVMPNMSGFDLIQRLRQNKKTRNIKVAFLTILNFSREQKERLKRYDVSDYIQKPFEKEDLLRRVKNIVG